MADDIEIKASITIEKDIETVFSFISKIENFPHYWIGVKRVELVAGDGGVGTVYKIIFPTLLNERSIEVEIIKIQDPFEFAFKNNSVPSGVINGFILKSIEDGKTEVNLYRDTDGSTISKLITLSLLVNFMESKKSANEFEKILTNLKNYLEQKAGEEE